MLGEGIDDRTVMARLAVISEARSWVGTPYHKNGRTKKVGADCATLIFCVYCNTGLISSEEGGIFSDPSIVPRSHDWWQHTSEEKYMLRVLRHALKAVEGISYPSLKALPGNIALVKPWNRDGTTERKLFNHAGIVVKWPIVIHSIGTQGVEQCNATSHRLWANKTVAVFDPFEKAVAEGRLK
jgi:cell wall-associated NlpC family hydrolase